MTNNEKSSFPIMPVKHWWVLRKKFMQTIPNTVTSSYLASVLGMRETSAKGNILPGLIQFKIIDDDGKPTDRAISWRDDTQYVKVCDEIKVEIYPQELLDALPGPSPNKDDVVRWFSNKTGVGNVSARKMALVYILLCEADPSKGQDIASKSKKPQKPKITKSPETIATEGAAISSSKKEIQSSTKIVPSDVPEQMASPSLHIDIQIHISSDASADQIDQIFASMAKHLYKN